MISDVIKTTQKKEPSISERTGFQTDLLYDAYTTYSKNFQKMTQKNVL